MARTKTKATPKKKATSTQAAPAAKQLKKNDFLAVVTIGPMTREEVVDALSEFTFIGSYLDYLIDHFEAQGKIAKLEDGSIQRKLGKSTAPKEVFRVVGNDDSEDGGDVELETKEVSGLLSDEEKAEGWALTKNAAIKKVTSAIFASYKAKTAAVRALA